MGVLMGVTRQEFVEQLKAEMKMRADLNHDGKLSKQDIEVVTNYVHALAETETRAHPTIALVVAFGVGAFVQYLFCLLFG